MFEVEIFTRKKFKNSRGECALSDILGAGVRGISRVRYSPLYVIDGDISYGEVKTIAFELLSDRIIETYVCRSCVVEDDVKSHKRDVVFFDDEERKTPAFAYSTVKIWYKDNVSDPISESAIKAIRDLGILKEVKVKRVDKYYLYGKVSQTILNNIVTKLLANTLVQEYTVNGIHE
jgi:phosphoribosylformylglycinamidine synthase